MSIDAPAATPRRTPPNSAPGIAPGPAVQPESRARTTSTIAPTPVKLAAMMPLLAYPNREHAHRLSKDFKFGFSLQFEGARVPLTVKNLKSAFDHKAVMREKLRKEIALGRIVGPFTAPPFKNFRCSPIGLVPKKSPGEFRLIQHLSAPRGISVNDNIPQEQCTVTYSSFDSAVEIVARLGHGALMGKADIKSAFRLLPVRPEDFELLGMCFEGDYYFDRSLFAHGLCSFLFYF